jgi:hypothetical protein
MISQRFYGHQEVFWGQKCIYCGDIVDPIIIGEQEFIDGSIATPTRCEERQR